MGPRAQRHQLGLTRPGEQALPELGPPGPALLLSLLDGGALRAVLLAGSSRGSAGLSLHTVLSCLLVSRRVWEVVAQGTGITGTSKQEWLLGAAGGLGSRGWTQAAHSLTAWAPPLGVPGLTGTDACCSASALHTVGAVLPP